MAKSSIPAVLGSDDAAAIHEVRGVRVMLDEDVAAAFGVETKRLNQARSIARKTDAEADGIDLDNLQKKIAMVEKLQGMYRDMEPDTVIDLIGDLAPRPKQVK